MSFRRPVMDSGTRWMTRWCIPATLRLSLISRPMSSFTWGNIHALSSILHVVVASIDASFLQSHLFCGRIPEKKNTDASNIKQNIVHSGRTNMTPDQLKKSTLNGPLSSPQVTKVGMADTIWYDMIGIKNWTESHRSTLKDEKSCTWMSHWIKTVFLFFLYKLCIKYKFVAF